MSRTSLIALVLVVVIGMSQSVLCEERGATESVQQLLDRQTSLQIKDGATLQDALDTIAHNSDVPVTIDWEALGEQKAALDSKVKLSVNNVSLRTTLDALLEPLDLAWVAGRESVLVTTRREAGLQTSTAQRVELALNDRVDWQILTGSTIQEALEFVARKEHVPVLVDWDNLLDERGLDRDRGLHDLTMDGVTFRTALKALLEPLDLTFAVSDEGLRVAARQEEPAAPQESAAPAKQLPKGELPAEERIGRVLNGETDLQILEGSTLQEALEFIARLHDVPVVPDWEGALADEQIDYDTLVTLQVSGVKLRSALKLLLEPIGLTWVIEDEVLKITTERAADRILEIHVYDVRRLGDADLDSERLAEAIQRTVRPHTWKESDAGGTATIVPLPGLLVVSQSQRVHGEIGALLEQIEDVALGGGNKPEPTRAPTPTY